MSENPDELPEAVGINGESDVVAERSGAETPKARRPIPADPPDEQDEREEEEVTPEDEHARNDEDVTRPDAGPTG